MAMNTMPSRATFKRAARGLADIANTTGSADIEQSAAMCVRQNLKSRCLFSFVTFNVVPWLF